MRFRIRRLFRAPRGGADFALIEGTRVCNDGLDSRQQQHAALAALLGAAGDAGGPMARHDARHCAAEYASGFRLSTAASTSPA